jgi:hypothetical protein
MDRAAALLDRLPVTAAAMTSLLLLVVFVTDGSTSKGTALVFFGVLFFLMPVVQALPLGDNSDILGLVLVFFVAFLAVGAVELLCMQLLRKRTSARVRWIIRAAVFGVFTLVLVATPPAGPLFKMM